MLNLVKALEDVFHHRTICNHQGEEKSKIFIKEKGQDVLILDTNLSKKILTSKSFISFNYFKLGIENLAAKNLPVTLLNDFYLENILFQEGTEHHQIKKMFIVMLDEVAIEVKKITPRLTDFFQKRKKIINSPLHFAHTYTRLCTGYLIALLTKIPLKKVYRALALRQNVFATYFQSSRHLAISMVFNCLYEDACPPVRTHPDWRKHLLAQHLIVMGIDPLIAGICGNIVENHKSPFSETMHRYCPTSFVVRKCIQSVSIEEIQFHPDDVCYVSLLPSQHQKQACPNQTKKALSLPFGLGNHTCVGKQLSFLLLDMAEKIVRTVFKQGFKKKAVLAPNGAFLAFKEA